MGTTTEKLQAILNSKAAIKAAIEGKGVENVGDVLSTYADAISSIPTGGGGWTGHADVEGLKAIGWTDEDIAYYQEHGVNWNEEDDQYHLVPDDNKALYGIINIDNAQQYKDIVVYLPKIDLSGETNISSKFAQFESMVAIPSLDFSSCTYITSLFQDCRSLYCIPDLILPNTLGITNLFSGCRSLITSPNIYAEKAVSLFQVYIGCYSLKNIGIAQMGELINIQNTYMGCRSLQKISIDASHATNINGILSEANSMRFCYVKGLIASIDISATSLLEKSSLLYMIENAAPMSAITITLSAYCYNKFSNDPEVLATLSAQPLVSLASA